MNQLEINHISKNFISHGREVKALNNINININQGDFVALIGLNGAGKTTLLRILSGILLPDSGEVKICNTCYKDNENKIKRKIGVVMGGDHSLYGKLTAAENLEFFGSFYALKQKQINKKVIELLNLFGLTQKKDILVETFSKGMKQKLLIAKALLHEPEILILDEPCNGIDIVTNLEVKNLLKKLNREYSKTIILTTHNLYDAEDLCSRLCILKEGQIIAEGAFNEVYQSYFKNAIISMVLRDELSDESKENLIKEPNVIDVIKKEEMREYGIVIDKEYGIFNLNNILQYINIDNLISINEKKITLEFLLQYLVEKK